MDKHVLNILSQLDKYGLLISYINRGPSIVNDAYFYMRDIAEKNNCIVNGTRDGLRCEKFSFTYQNKFYCWTLVFESAEFYAFEKIENTLDPIFNYGE